MVEIFEKLGFSVQSKSGRTGRILSMTNLDKYLGVSVHFTDDETFILKSGNLKFFGEMVLPEMSIKGREFDDVKRMCDVMKHYHDVIEENQPW